MRFALLGGALAFGMRFLFLDGLCHQLLLRWRMLTIATGDSNLCSFTTREAMSVRRCLL